RVIDKVREAEIDISIVPQNFRRAGRYRGVSRAKELLEAGVNVVAGTDNMNDAWYAFGKLDPLDLTLLAFLTVGFASDEDIPRVWQMVTAAAARAVGAHDQARGLVAGAPADLVVFEGATSLVDVLRNLPRRRTTIKGGRVVAGLDANAMVAGPAQLAT